jgi:phosphate transport system permease protein
MEHTRIGLIRRLRHGWGWLSSGLATVIVLAALASIIGTVLVKGLPSFRWSVLWTATQGVAGGLENAWLGTLWLILWATLAAAPLGVAAGLYCAWLAPPRWAAAIRFWCEVLSGLPSIVIGYVGYAALVLALGWGFSTLAGAAALAAIMLPYIVRSTDAGLMQVPAEVRDGGLALGLTPVQTALRIGLRAAAPAALSGTLLAIAIGIGETAPLLFTAGWSPLNPNGQLLHRPVGYLTYVVWTYIEQPYDAAHALAYNAALVLLVLVLALQVAARFAIRRR